MMTEQMLVSSVLPGTAAQDLAYSELYSDPPDLARCPKKNR